MLKDLVNEKLIKLQIEASDWEDAVRKAAQPLVDEGKVKTSYVDDIIKGVKEMGPLHRTYEACGSASCAA